MRGLLIVLLAVVVTGCELTITQPAPVVATPTGTPAPAPITITSVNTNTNTNTDTSDRSDTETPTPRGPEGPEPLPGAVIPLPGYGEGVVREIAAANPTLLANSCEGQTGASAWAFLDLVIRTLQARDARWGYLCKDASCSRVAADIVAYRASTGNTGIWIVDMIGNHCPGAGTGDIPTVRWGILPFETRRPWTGQRP
jgi:hypothetical protein